MGFIISIIFAVLIFFLLYFISKAVIRYWKSGIEERKAKIEKLKEHRKSEDYDQNGQQINDLNNEIRQINLINRIVRIIPYSILTVWLILAIIPPSIYQIPAGHIGVIYEFGAIRAQITEGFQLVWPWRSVRIANIQIQSHKFERLVAFSEETQDVFFWVTLNIRISPQAIQGLFRTVGPDYFEKVVAPRVAQNFKDQTVKYKSVAIAPHREEIRKIVRERLEDELSLKYSIEVVDLLLDNIDFKEEFKSAIEKKQIATQNALEQEQRVQEAKYKADQVIEDAKGKAEAILVNAKKQAKANLELSKSLTPALIQYSLIQKLGDKIEVIILPAGQNFILSPDIFKGRKTE